ncbi:7481_t:CDS:2 [Paraglomus occultum]|uniref:7481_t:CDS:1 n=1 Tax=Paraglomus occultum TaxID=144539 RepID=A0A9N8VXW9_9GLOM|nr:7481_t:CDS:2 [Paraglomus occultum]
MSTTTNFDLDSVAFSYFKNNDPVEWFSRQNETVYPYRQTSFIKKYWKQITAERARGDAENDLENKRIIFKLESQIDVLDVLALAHKCQTHNMMENLNLKKSITADINTEEY